MPDAPLDPDPPDKPPAETFADAEVTTEAVRLSDPHNDDAWLASDRRVNVEDHR
jgi:hypothetical protein